MNYPDILLKKGVLNPKYVRELKDRLNKLGFGPLTTANPDFGSTTEAMVKKFQLARGLNPDGEVGPLTWHRLLTPRIEVISIATSIDLVALEFCLRQLRVREKTGKNDGVEVEMYLRSIGLGKGYAWCVAGQYWCEDQAADQLQVPNPMFRTGGVHALWRNTPSKFKFTEPKKGRLMLMDFGKGQGHITRVKRDELIRTGGIMKVNTVEGNTSADPTSAVDDREGQGWFERLRDPRAKNIMGYIGYP